MEIVWKERAPGKFAAQKTGRQKFMRYASPLVNNHHVKTGCFATSEPHFVECSAQ